MKIQRWKTNDCALQQQLDEKEKAGEAILPVEFKVWIVLFTCAATRALHLKLVMKIDAVQIVMAIDRFVNRRGKPSMFWSDNGTQLLRANKDLIEMHKEAMTSAQHHTAEKGIEWNCIVENAPWWGGFWERPIGTCKRLMRKILGKASLTVKELETVMCRVEGTLNSRPITFRYDSVGEPRPLTPIDLILGPDRVSSLPIRYGDETMPSDTTRLELTDRVRYKQLLFNQFENISTQSTFKREPGTLRKRAVTSANWYNHLQLQLEQAENSRLAAIYASAKEENEIRIPHPPTPAQPANHHMNLTYDDAKGRSQIHFPHGFVSFLL